MRVHARQDDVGLRVVAHRNGALVRRGRGSDTGVRGVSRGRCGRGGGSRFAAEWRAAPFLHPEDDMTYPNTQLFINGQWQDAADGKTLAVFNPATGKEIGRVAHASTKDLDRAL